MKILALTIFPELFNSFRDASIIKRAVERGLLSIETLDIRSFAEPPHYKVDDTPYGGGPGMVMRPEPLSKAITHAKEILTKAPVVLLSPAGSRFTQRMARELSEQSGLILVCGRYEGVDQRVIDRFVDREISIGDYVLMGGEIPAMAVVEAVSRLIPGVLGNAASPEHESFSDPDHPLLEAPCYTKPASFDGATVPEILLSGDHAKIAEWRRVQSEIRTQSRRPDLLTRSITEGGPR